ncbi:type II toxin-antitoxin system PemK/MazF family toxin [Leuconostoc gasicomitatum]|uniref:type II toxin-antitoxin system PemK/MazF family toxin n=1 Tax=Leuconostoc gasicomitatum TaxID=115778 RepID=UPI0007DE8B09|nr:type II toxin-antitoxin system PemK/MazF family toxin [Leuconostoc gasicomitatum]CUW11387.1 hypothetical protein PB1E_1818 [Leuconostoc gasicomitatum]
MQKNLYWAYVSFTEVNGGKKRPVLYLRQDDKNYVVFRLTSKYENKSEFIKQKYVEIVNWQQAGLSKPSWVDTVQVYTLPVNTTKLSYIGQLSSADIQRLINNI